MKLIYSMFGAALLAVTLTACGGGDEPADDTPEAVNGEVEHVDGDNGDMSDGGGDDDMASGGDEPMRSAGTDPEFISGCVNSSNLSREMCTCIAASAEAELSDNSRDFLTASLNENAEEATAIRMRMSIAEVTEAGMFMMNATTDCAERGFND